jgi:hypothetical protein
MPSPSKVQGAVAVSVKQSVADALRSRNPDAADRFEAQYHESLDQPIAARIAQANRYWRRALTALEIDTIAVREYLVDECDFRDWLRHFHRGVLPVVIAYQLPIV